MNKLIQEVNLSPSEIISKEMLERLKEANDKYSSSKNFQQYLKNLAEIFKLSGELKITTESKFFLAGFLEGEASLNVSAKKFKTATFGMLLDPEFSITQHVNGFSVLYFALQIFQTGRIRHKSGSNATLVFVIDNRISLEEKVIPFYKQYVVPYGSTEKVRRLAKFETLLDLFNKGAHKQLHSFSDNMLPLWDQMRKQTGQKNEMFKSLEAARLFVREFYDNKKTK